MESILFSNVIDRLDCEAPSPLLSVSVLSSRSYLSSSICLWLATLSLTFRSPVALHPPILVCRIVFFDLPRFCRYINLFPLVYYPHLCCRVLMFFVFQHRVLSQLSLCRFFVFDVIRCNCCCSSPPLRIEAHCASLIVHFCSVLPSFSFSAAHSFFDLSHHSCLRYLVCFANYSQLLCDPSMPFFKSSVSNFLPCSCRFHPAIQHSLLQSTKFSVFSLLFSACDRCSLLRSTANFRVSSSRGVSAQNILYTLDKVLLFSRKIRKKSLKIHFF